MDQPRSLSVNAAVFALLVTLGVASRIVIETPNVSAVAACALFAGFFFRRNALLALATPLLSMLLSDLVIGFHHPLVMAAVYISMIASVGLGALVSRRRGFASIALGTFAGSALFFVVTNLMVWVAGSLYALDTAGLIRCFTMAVPFFKYTLAGDVAFSAAIFGVFAAINALAPRGATQNAAL